MRSVHHEAVFHEEDDARAVAALLLEAGHAATVRRGRFAGEDDDEDQPWVLGTEAPRPLLARLAGPREGVLEAPQEAGPRLAAPMDLPTAPRRAHRPRGRRGPSA